MDIAQHPQLAIARVDAAQFDQLGFGARVQVRIWRWAGGFGQQLWNFGLAADASGRFAPGGRAHRALPPHTQCVHHEQVGGAGKAVALAAAQVQAGAARAEMAGDGGFDAGAGVAVDGLQRLVEDQQLRPRGMLAVQRPGDERAADLARGQEADALVEQFGQVEVAGEGGEAAFVLLRRRQRGADQFRNRGPPVLCCGAELADVEALVAPPKPLLLLEGNWQDVAGGVETVAVADTAAAFEPAAHDERGKQRLAGAVRAEHAPVLADFKLEPVHHERVMAVDPATGLVD